MGESNNFSGTDHLWQPIKPVAFLLEFSIFDQNESIFQEAASLLFSNSACAGIYNPVSIDLFVFTQSH